MKKHRSTIALLLLACLGLSLALQQERVSLNASEEALQVLINGHDTKLKPIESNGVLYLPLTFPVEEGKSVWQVKVNFDKTKNRVTIEKIKAGEKYREKTKCDRCTATGKCQACYPSGSGSSANGGTCNICDGTGKCQKCDGNKEY